MDAMEEEASHGNDDVVSFAERLMAGDERLSMDQRTPNVARMLLRYHHEEDLEDDEEEEEEDEEEEEMDDASTAAGTTGTRIRASTEVRRAAASEEAVERGGGAAEDDLLMGGSSVDDGGTTAPSHASTMISAVPNLNRLLEQPSLREIGMEDIISFQLSSAKPGNGVEQLQDPNLETYWQSDGLSQPHWIQIQLPRRLPITHVALYLDYQCDESYTPRTLRVETGLTVVQDLPSYHNTPNAPSIMEVNEPVGWCIFPIYQPPEALDTNPVDSLYVPEHVIIPRAHWVRIAILSMHQNGRDTHVRRVALFGQRTNVIWPMKTMAAPTLLEEENATTTDHEEILLYAQTRLRRDNLLLRRPDVGTVAGVRTEDDASSYRNFSSDFSGISLFSTIR